MEQPAWDGIAFECMYLTDQAVIFDGFGIDQAVEKTFEQVIQIAAAAVWGIEFDFDLHGTRDRQLPGFPEDRVHMFVILSPLRRDHRMFASRDRSAVSVFTDRKWKFKIDHCLLQGGVAGVAGAGAEALPAAYPDPLFLGRNL